MQSIPLPVIYRARRLFASDRGESEARRGRVDENED